jgi:hypothetical protein
LYLSDSRRAQEDIGQIQIHAIQQIEGLGAELQARAPVSVLRSRLVSW